MIGMRMKRETMRTDSQKGTPSASTPAPPIVVSILVPILVGTIMVPTLFSILVKSPWQDKVAENNHAYSQQENTR
jgi:hypothetical protein